MGKWSAKVGPAHTVPDTAIDETPSFTCENIESDGKNVSQPTASGITARLLYLSQLADSVIHKLFYRLGAVIHDHTWWFVFIPILAGIACISGLTEVEIQWNAEALYTPQVSMIHHFCVCFFLIVVVVAAAAGICNIQFFFLF